MIDNLREHLLKDHGIGDVGVYTEPLPTVHRQIHRALGEVKDLATHQHDLPVMVVGVDPETGATQLLNDEQIAAHSATLGDAGESTCPICNKTWLVTMRNDCLVPSCGCYGFGTGPENPNRPCERCGMRHAMSCDKKAAS